MKTSGRMVKDLPPVFGTRGRVSEVLSGKRSISKEQANSKEQAKKLASLFKVTADSSARLSIRNLDCTQTRAFFDRRTYPRYLQPLPS
jgi:hypothetical protein